MIKYFSDYLSTNIPDIFSVLPDNISAKPVELCCGSGAPVYEHSDHQKLSDEAAAGVETVQEVPASVEEVR